MRASRQYKHLSESFNAKKLYNIAIVRLFVKREVAFLRHPLGDLGVTYTIHPQLVGKLVVDFLQVIIEHFSLAIQR